MKSFFKWVICAACLFVLFTRVALAGALDPWSTWVANQPATSKQVPPGVLVMRGTGTNSYYMVEVDPATGRIPVDALVTLGYDTNYGVVGSNTLRGAAQIGNATGAADFGAGASGAQTLRVVLPTNQTAIPASQSGTWNITNVSGTVSLPTGAATETTLAKIPVAQGSTTSGQSGLLVQGAVTTAAPSYTTGQTSPLSLTTAGGLRVDASSTTQPVSGTVTANAGTGNFSTDQVATTTGTFQDGLIAFGSLTTSYQTVITTGGSFRSVAVRNDTNATLIVSLNGGSTDSLTLESGDAILWDLKTMGRTIPVSTALQAKYTGSAPTQGSIHINGVY